MNNELYDEYSYIPELIYDYEYILDYDEYADMPELIDDYEYAYIPELIDDEYADMPRLIDEDRIGIDTDYEDD